MSKSFESSFGRKIIGWKKEDKESKIKIGKNIKELFLQGAEELTPYELEKTEKDKQIIEQLEWAVDSFIKFFGGKPKPFELNRIHLLEQGG